MPFPSESPIVRVDGPSGRFYRHVESGRELASVTTVLGVISKPALVAWSANTERALVMDAAAELHLDTSRLPSSLSRSAYMATLSRRIGEVKAHRREMDKACEIGAQAHAVIEWSLRSSLGYTVGPRPRVRDEALVAFAAYQDWTRTHDVQPILIESQVWSLTHGYAGTLDLLARVDGRLMLVDFKTSKGLYAEYGLQNVAYQVALADMGHHVADGGLLVRVPKTADDAGGFEVAEVPPVADLFPVFQAALQVFGWWHAEEQKSKAAWRARRAGAA